MPRASFVIQNPQHYFEISGKIRNSVADFLVLVKMPILFGMDFADAIAVVISRSFFLAMTHRVVDSIDMIVPLPFIDVTSGVFLGVAVHVFLQRLLIAMLPYPQPALATFPTDGSHDGRAIILIGPMPSAFIGAAARRIARVAVMDYCSTRFRKSREC